MLTKQEALNLLNEKMQNQNLRKHCWAVGAVMRAIALYIKNQNSKIKMTDESEKIDEGKWEVVGILHDGDYEVTKDTPKKHTLLMHEWLKEKGADQEILNAILSHNFSHTGNTSPSNKMEWALYCCDELTGLIIAVTLVRPERKLSAVTIDNVLSKWNEKSFAAGVDRKQIETCEEKLEIPLKEFIGIALSAMQGISGELGL